MNRLLSKSPLIQSLRGYGRAEFQGDFVAGLTTAVMLIPQGMAYAMLAGLPPIIGLYSAVIPQLFYAFIGTSRQLSVGPVAMDSLLVAAGVGAIAQAGSDAYLSAAILLALMVGVIQLLMGVLRMGFLVNFLSHPVISGFTSAAALIIGLSQFKHLLGVEMAGSTNGLGLVAQVATKVPEASIITFAIGIVAVALLLTLKRFAPKVPGALIAVVSGAVVVWLSGWHREVAIVGDVPPGLPALLVPQINLPLIQTLLPTALVIAMVAFMESISVSKAYARKNKYQIKANQELVALGVANVAGSFFQGYPVTGGFSRTAVNASAGAKTNVAALITAGVIALSLLFLTPLFYYLPKAVLAAIIVTAVFGLIDFAEVRHLKQVKRADLILLAIAFFATLSLGIIEGMGVGVGASLLWFVIRTTRPHVAVLGRVPGTTHFRNIRRQNGLTTYTGVIALRMDAQFYFGNIAFLRDTLAQLESEMQEPLHAVILDFSAINGLDSSAETALSEMREDFSTRGVDFYLTGVKGPVRDVLESSGLSQKLGVCCKCLTVHEAFAMLDLHADSEGQPPAARAQESAMNASSASAKL